MKRTPLNSPHARLRVAGRNLAAQSQSWRDLDLRAKALISLVVAVGTGVLLYAAVYPTSKNIAQFICYLLIAILAARLKVHLPGITGTMSVNFLFILLGVLELSLPETLILGSAAVVVQCFYRDRPSPIQVTFNLCASAFATAVAYDVYHLAIGEGWFRSHPLLLGLAASTYFLANTGSIATVISLTERKALNKIWVDCYFWSFPYYLVGAAFAGMLGWFNRAFGWETSLLIVPVIYLIYRSYRLYLGKLEDEKRHVEEMANLHLRTIEALALAIEAKDHTTHDHLQRVRVYAIEVAKELKISPPEMEALHAAALLHDIGKLAIPEHIISKPGRLTPEEFEKMKIHPVVGAEILERVRFPYPVVLIVRAHHEKWDGPGFPFGLKGERGEAPAAGFEDIAVKDPAANEATFLFSIAAARQEAQTLFELSQDLGASLSLGETLSVFSVKLKRLIPYDAIAIYVKRGVELIPEYVNGDNFRLFSSLRIPLGQGLSGWVAQNRKPIVNGNPSVEPGYLNDPTKFSTLRSALAVPLEGLAGVVGVIALYHAEHDAFTSDHLRILLAVSSKMALAVENALKYQQAESSAVTDYLTGLPNARSLFLQLDRELARCKRDNSSLIVMVSDMDGFKQINGRFGHLEGNRVLRLFAQALKDTCREYDYVARMGGDEFVIVAPGLTAETAIKKAESLRELARQAGAEVCGEDILSLSVGQAVYPSDGKDAEALLAEADRRMYIEKQQQPSRKNRRTYPRMKCRVTIELRPEDGDSPIFGNLIDISLGGCFVETSAIMPPGAKLKLIFSIDDGRMQAEGSVVRIDPGCGVAIQFNDMGRDEREKMHRVLEFVHNTTMFYDNRYFSKLLNR